MKLTVRGLFGKRDTDDTIRAALGDFEISSFPEPAMRVLELLRDPESTTIEIADWLERDPGLHVHVLRSINSAAYNPANPVSSVRHAVSLLGRARFESLVLGVAVKAVVPRVDEAGFDTAAFWRLSVRRGALARVVSRFVHPASEMEAFTVGLLQDIAVPLLARCRGREYVELYDTWLRGDHLHLMEAERAIVGTDHATVGAMIAREWKLPDHLSRSIASHHDEFSGENVDIAPVLVAQMRRAGDDEIAAVVDACERNHGVDREALESAIAGALEDTAALL